MSTIVFSQSALDAAIKQALPDSAVVGTHAIVGTVDQTGAQVVASFRFKPDGGWTVQAAARHDWSGNNEVGAKVLLQW